MNANSTKVSVMFDTNVFNHILGDQAFIKRIRENLNVFATHIQRDEINKTSDVSRKNELLYIFKEITTGSVLPTESAVWDISKFDECKFGEGTLYQNILSILDKKNGSKKNNPEDVLIAETAIRNGLVLVTHDSDLFSVVTQLKGAATNIYALIGTREYSSA